MENITIQDILEATDGTLLCGDPSMKIDHLSTNSMEIGPNTYLYRSSENVLMPIFLFLMH